MREIKRSRFSGVLQMFFLAALLSRAKKRNAIPLMAEKTAKKIKKTGIFIILC
jgi:hypothetical protein